MSEEKNIEMIVDKTWSNALRSWNNPSVPKVIAATDVEKLGVMGRVLADELGFMKYPEFQVYANLLKIMEKFGDLERGTGLILDHEVGHRFCPYDGITSLILQHQAKKGLKSCDVDYDIGEAAKGLVNLFSDTCVNTHRVRTGNKEDYVWAYRELSKGKNSRFWRVYMGGFEKIWNAKILDESIRLSDDEEKAARNIERLFKRNPLEMAWWDEGIEEYAKIMAPFFDIEDSKNACLSHSASGNIPKEVDPEEIARRIAKQGTNGLPTNKNAVKEFSELMAGYGQGDPVKASIMFYENLAKRYVVRFAKRPFGSPRKSPFSVSTWNASDPTSQLDVYHTLLTGGRIIPGVTTRKWKSRVKNTRYGEQEIIPALDIYLDSSESMVNPVEEVSLPVLSGFVAAQRAEKAGVRAINYNGGIVGKCNRTNNLQEAYEVLVKYGKGGTVFPINEFLENPEQDPRLALIITDTFLANTETACDAIRTFKQRNQHNRVSVYAITGIPDIDELQQAGAECIQGTTTKIFDQILGKTEKTYNRK